MINEKMLKKLSQMQKKKSNELNYNKCSKHQKYLSKICPALIISFIMGFMFFIYESITLFSTTTEDFWFGLWVLVKSNIIYLFIFVFLAVIFSSLILLISNFFLLFSSMNILNKGFL